MTETIAISWRWWDENLVEVNFAEDWNKDGVKVEDRGWMTILTYHLNQDLLRMEGGTIYSYASVTGIYWLVILGGWSQSFLRDVSIYVYSLFTFSEAISSIWFTNA